MKYKTDEERHQAHLRDMKKWREKNKDKIRAYELRRRPQRLEYMRRKSKEHHKKHNQIIDKQLGVFCLVCGETKTLHCHEIYGFSHQQGRKYIVDHMEDFVRLCNYCHQAVHWCMKYMNVDWKTIQKNIGYPYQILSSKEDMDKAKRDAEYVNRLIARGKDPYEAFLELQKFVLGKKPRISIKPY